MRVLTAVLLAPVLFAQALHVRRVTPRLPGASGPVTGFVPGGDPLRLLVLGESTVDGVGAASHEEALTGQLALALAERTGRGVRWQAVGCTGANARVVLEELLPAAEPADLVVIALGVNDTIELHSAGRYRRDLLRLVVAVRRELGPVPVLLVGVPPMGRFPVLPQPLRAVLGARSATRPCRLRSSPATSSRKMVSTLVQPVIGTGRHNSRKRLPHGSHRSLAVGVEPQ